MPSSNLELVRSIIAAWERGDWSNADWADPEIELVFVDGPSPGHWTGLTDIAAGARANVIDAWQDYRVAAVGYRDIDADRVLVLLHAFGRGKTSGLDLRHLQPRGANIFHIRDGKVTRLISYFDGERAFADLGLTSEGEPS